MAIRKKRASLTPKKLYKINNVIYDSKVLFDFHVECDKALKQKLIESFEVPKSIGKKSRFNVYKPIIDDIKFDSLMEAKYYIKLLNDKANNIIKNFDRQIVFNLQPAFKKGKKKYKAIDYICDFVIVYPDDTFEVIDVKGRETPEFKIKHKLFEFKYPETSLKLIQYYEPENKWLELSEIRKIKRNKKKDK